MSDKSKHESDFKPLTWDKIRPFLIIAAIATMLVFAFYYAIFGGRLSDEQEHWGQFGDYVGGLLNPVFGFLSFFALLFALVLQSKELHASTAQLKASAEALKIQHEVLTKQSFENTYFQMLRRVSEIISEMNHGKLHGRLALEQIYRSLLGQMKNAAADTESIRDAYIDFYNQFSPTLGHYYRTLYHVFTLIDRAPFNYDEQSIYANIARAQFSDVELALLYYNGTTGEGAKGFKLLIEKYGLLKHVRPDLLAYPIDFDNPDFYSRTAFMSAEERKTYNSKSE